MIVLSPLFEALEVGSHDVSVVIAYVSWCSSYACCDVVVIVSDVAVAAPVFALLDG